MQGMKKRRGDDTEPCNFPIFTISTFSRGSSLCASQNLEIPWFYSNLKISYSIPAYFQSKPMIAFHTLYNTSVCIEIIVFFMSKFHLPIEFRNLSTKLTKSILNFQFKENVYYTIEEAFMSLKELKLENFRWVNIII